MNYSWEQKKYNELTHGLYGYEGLANACDDVFLSETIFTNNISVLGNVQYN